MDGWMVDWVDADVVDQCETGFRKCVRLSVVSITAVAVKPSEKSCYECLLLISSNVVRFMRLKCQYCV